MLQGNEVWWMNLSLFAYGVLLFSTAKKVGKKAATAWGF
jgi:hypothetical protein